jgi:hypothetical protein
MIPYCTTMVPGALLPTRPGHIAPGFRADTQTRVNYHSVSFRKQASRVFARRCQARHGILRIVLPHDPGVAEDEGPRPGACSNAQTSCATDGRRQTLNRRIQRLPASGTLCDSSGSAVAVGANLPNPNVTYTPRPGFAGTECVIVSPVKIASVCRRGAAVHPCGSIRVRKQIPRMAHG